MAMGQYLLIPFLVGWTSIYQLFWCELQGYQGFDTLPYSKNGSAVHRGGGGGLAEQAKAWKELGEEAPVEGRAAYDGQTQVTLW